MTPHALLGLTAGILPLLAAIPYIRSVFRRETKPNVVSWSIWFLVVLITMGGQIVAGASWSITILIGSTVVNLAVLALCIFGYGYKEFKFVDKFSLMLAGLALVLWGATGDPLLAIVFAVLADAIAYIPTYAKILRDPRSEAYLYWGAHVCADVLAIFVATHNPANLLFPISYLIMNTLVFVFAFLGAFHAKRHLLK